MGRCLSFRRVRRLRPPIRCHLLHNHGGRVTNESLHAAGSCCDRQESMLEKWATFSTVTFSNLNYFTLQKQASCQALEEDSLLGTSVSLEPEELPLQSLAQRFRLGPEVWSCQPETKPSNTFHLSSLHLDGRWLTFMQVAGMCCKANYISLHEPSEVI